jgi:protein required for attachment to host cells
MVGLKIAAGDWVVVCDGAKALILENAGDEKFPNLKTREVHTHGNPPVREPGTAAIPRPHQTKGIGHAPPVESGLRDDRERTFLEDVADRLHAALGAGEAKRFVLVAPPKALGALREALSPAVRQATKCEVDKDLVKLPVYEIEKHLAA